MLLEHILTESISCIEGLVFNKEQIEKSVSDSMYKIISEEIILNGVKMGYVRIDIHDRIRSILTKPLKSFEDDNRFDLNTIADIFESDNVISEIIRNYNISLEPKDYIGRCVEQINKFYSVNSIV
jgi:adenylosuccinate lyase